MADRNDIHPLTRSSLRGMKFPEVLIERQVSEALGFSDLSSSINSSNCTYSRYPDLEQNQLKNLYADLLAKESGNQLHPSEILFSRGSLEAIDLLIRAFCEPTSDSIAVPIPSFFMYEYWAQISDIKINKIQLQGENYDQLPINLVLRSNPKITFVCTPNNPVGSHISLEAIEELLKRSSGLVVVDEAYIEFSDLKSALSMHSKYENLVVLRTFSKAWGLAGARCGAVIASHKVINSLSIVNGPFAFPTPSQEMLKQRLEDKTSFLDYVFHVRTERERIISELKSLSSVRKVFSSHSNFILVQFDHVNDVYRHLYQKKLLVDKAMHNVPGTLKISIGTREQNDSLLCSVREL